MTGDLTINMAKQKRKREQEDEFIDMAIDQDTMPAPQQVEVPMANASTIPTDPLTPPQPGMVPMGWMWPQQNAVAAAMDTGDVEIAGLAPDAGALDIAPEEGEDMFTDEDREVIEEYRKWKAKRVKEKKRKKIKEEEEEDMDLDPVMPEDVDLDMPPADGFEDEDLLDVDMEDSDDDFLDELEDIVIDINDLFQDLGGDIDSLEGEDLEDDLDGINLDDDMEIEGDVDFGDEGEEEEVLSDEEIVERIKKARKNRVKEAIKYPAGDPRREATHVEDEEGEFPEDLFDEKSRVMARARLARKKREAASQKANVKKTSEAIEQRRALVKKLRTKKLAELSSSEIAAKGRGDVDQLDAEIGYESVQSVIDKIGKSKIKETKDMGSSDKRFLEKYNEKKQLNWKKLLDNGLLG